MVDTIAAGMLALVVVRAASTARDAGMKALGVARTCCVQLHSWYILHVVHIAYLSYIVGHIIVSNMGRVAQQGVIARQVAAGRRVAGQVGLEVEMGLEGDRAQSEGWLPYDGGLRLNPITESGTHMRMDSVRPILVDQSDIPTHVYVGIGHLKADARGLLEIVRRGDVVRNINSLA